MSEGDIWEGYEPASIEAAGYPVLRIMVRSLRVSGGQRIVPRARPFRSGAKLDTTGAKEHVHVIEALFSNDAEEPGVTDDGGLPMWPDRLDQLEKIIDAGVTMTLNLPWKRGLRVKCDPWERKADAESDRGAEFFSGTFIEDNEDNLNREALLKPSARATLSRKVEETQFDAESSGIWDGSLSELTGFVSELIGLLNSPNDYMEQVSHAAAKVNRCIDEVRRAFGSGSDGRDQFGDPSSFPVRMRLLELEDLAASADSDARRSSKKLRRHYPSANTTIWRIATANRQNAQSLMEINSQIEDFSFIYKGTPVWVFAE